MNSLTTHYRRSQLIALPVTTCRSTSGRNAFDDSDNFTHHPSHQAL